MSETVTKYILDLFSEKEEMKNLPEEFVTETTKWAKSWFLEDPKSYAKLEDPNKSIEVKKDIIQDKLEDLKDNPLFIKELTERLITFEQQKKAALKNILKDTDIDAQGNVHIGDITTTTIYQSTDNQIISKVSDILFSQTKKLDNIIFSGVIVSIFGIIVLILSRFYSNYSVVLFSIGLVMMFFGTTILFLVQRGGTRQIKSNIYDNRAAIDELQSLSINLIDVTKQMRNYLVDNVKDVNDVLSKTAPFIEKIPSVFIPQSLKDLIKNKQVAASQISNSADQLEEVINDIKDALVKAEISKLRGYKQKIITIIQNINKTIKK